MLHDGMKRELTPPPGRLTRFAIPRVMPGCAANQPAPHYGMRNDVCRRSCGAMGGTTSFYDACSAHGLADVGIAYDVPFCCQ